MSFRWLENDADNAPNLPMVKEGCYVRLYGSLRVQDGKKMLMILKMFPIDNLNEISTHLLEVVQARLEAEVLSKGPSQSKIQANNPGAELVNSMSFMSGDGNASRQTGLSAVQEKVFSILQTVSNTAAGLSRSAIVQKFTPNQQREVNAAIDFLISEGHAYSTIDSDHFKVTDM